MPRKKKEISTGVVVPEDSDAKYTLESLKADNARLQAELEKAKPKKGKHTDGSVTFKSPWPGFQIVLKEAGYVSTGLRSSIIVNPILARFVNQVCTFQPGDTFEENGNKVRKIDRMREIYRGYVLRRKRPPFIEVTEETDLKIQPFRMRVPPSQLVEFRGPLVELPAIPPPPPKEAEETIQTMERQRPMYGR